MRRYPNRPPADKTVSEASAPASYLNDDVPTGQDEACDPEPPSNVDREDFPDFETSVVDNGDEGPYVEGDNIMYTTGDVAARLHISRDMARNHIRDFEEFLHVSKTRDGKYGHMSIRSTDMDTLEQIVRLRKNRHSVDQVKQILRDPYLASKLNVPTADFSELLNEALVKSNTLLLSEVRRIIDSNQEQNKLLIDSNVQKSDQIRELTEEVEGLRQLVKQQSEALLVQSDALNDQCDIIKEQSAAIESVKTMLNEQAAGKKKGFWGLFK